MDTLFGQEGQCGEIESTNSPIKDKNLRLHSLLFVCCLELKTVDLDARHLCHFALTLSEDDQRLDVEENLVLIRTL